MSQILVVDDDADSREALVGYLRKLGHEVLDAPNGRDALRVVVSGSVDAVVLDWMMPEMNGIDFLRIIRSYLRLQSLPVVLVTAYKGPHIDAAKSLGVQSVFQKAEYTFADLANALNTAMREAQDHDV